MVNVKRAVTVTIARVSIRRAAVVLSVALAVAGAAHGDWLVLTSGEAIETKGAWTVQGSKVVFTSKGGVLSSVRASEVNVDSSRALTAKKSEATKVVASAPAPKQAPVLVLTDKDFSKAVAPPAPAAEGAVDGAAKAASGEAVIEGEAGAPASTAPAAAGAAETAASALAAPSQPVAAPPAPLSKRAIVPSTDSLETRVAYQMPSPPALRITSWSARPTGDEQLSIFGVALNTGARVTAAVDIAVALIDSEGRQIESAVAMVSSTALMPNAQADFEAKFEGEPNFAEIQFSVRTVEVEMSNPANDGRLEEPVGDEPHATSRTSAAKPKPPSS